MSETKVGSVVPLWTGGSSGGGGGPPSGPAGGDLRGTYPNPIVKGLQTYPIAVTAPVTGQVLTWNGAQWQGSGGTYRRAFTDADLAAGILTVTHARNVRYNGVAVYSNANVLITPDTVTDVDANNLTVTLASFQAANGGAIPGTWHVVVNS